MLEPHGERRLVQFSGRVKSGGRRATNPVVIGDRVRLRLRDDTASIQEVLPRRNELFRRAPGRDTLRDVLAANLDSVVVVHSLREPSLSTGRLDRLLAIVEQAEIPASVVLNKRDLASPEETAQALSIYETAGYPVIVSSARTQEGIPSIRASLRGITALIGPSGAGKSSLLNRIDPRLELHTAEISDATGKGRHTTVAAELLPLEGGDYVADTPGLRSLALTDIDRYEVGSLFPEIRPLIGRCRFPDCLHLGEPGCVVRDAVDSGRLSVSRYESYRRLVEDVTAGYIEDWERVEG